MPKRYCESFEAVVGNKWSGPGLLASYSVQQLRDDLRYWTNEGLRLEQHATALDHEDPDQPACERAWEASHDCFDNARDFRKELRFRLSY